VSAIHPVQAPDGRWAVGRTILTNVHPPEACAGEPCTFHAPTEHRMRHMPLLWRDDRGIVERVCAHGVGHPDPDQKPYWKRTHRMYESVHGCDKCCTWW
jgi:hypothetical protein